MSFKPLFDGMNMYIHTESKILEKHKQLIINAVKPCFFMSCEESPIISNDSRKSKIGGLPLVNEEMLEFLNQNDDYVFVFQLNLEDLNDYSGILNFPSEGMISVFLKSSSNGKFLDPSQAKFFFNKHLKGIAIDHSPKLIIPQNEITFKKSLSIPDDEDQFWEEIEEDYEDFGFDIYEELEDNIVKICSIEESHCSHAAGYDLAVQSCVNYDYAAKELIKLPITDKEYYLEYQNKWDEIKALSKEYILICQVDSDIPNSTLNQYFDGVIYLGIKKEDLEIRNFTNIKFAFQNT